MSHIFLDSEGSTGLGSAVPSPTAPKRPWFARLFDFKPQVKLNERSGSLS